VRLLAQLSEGQKQREVVQYDTVSTMSMRIPAAWMMSRRDESEVDVDTGCVVSCVESMLVARQLMKGEEKKGWKYEARIYRGDRADLSHTEA